ncbi:DUF927 domain-containing protein [Vibrio cholerae]|uniref:DUF927 domain-containing protein n=1 Tax=Vibrio cholerae TaxID=666 RepID=UPI00115815EA|nr:DUF927 domain-containing protein [Vibrio cholerae]TQQ48654.1 DUF927 domain-containing protein [Vibrio cholerae]HDI3252751.1 DUF927 domain-containing protein [Vibrio cholerae]
MNQNVIAKKVGLILEEKDKDPILIAGPTHVKAFTYDPTFMKDFGVLLQWTSRSGNAHERVFKMKDILADSGKNMLQSLADTGLFIHHKAKYWHFILDYLMNENPEKTVVTVEKTGWYFGQFVSPSWIAGFGEQEVMYNGDSPGQLKSNGTFLEWQDNVATLCQDNALMIFTLCAAFAAPLLDKLDWDSFIIHFLGSSKNGKTTLIRLSASVYSDYQYRDTWSSTANGLAGRAKDRNCMLVLLDELHQAEPEDVSKVIYQIGNGVSKLRGNKDGGPRPQDYWSLIGLSTGEVSLEQKLAEANKKPQAGQLMRFFQIPLFQTFGVFENLHGSASPKEFAERIAKVTKQQFGTALQPFLNQISAMPDLEQTITAQIKEISQTWINNLQINPSNQVAFAADRFSFLAAVGELAIELGAIPWEKGSARFEIEKVFEAWLANYSEEFDYEERHIREQLRKFLPKSQYSIKPQGAETKIGWWKLNSNELSWHIRRDAFKTGLKLEFDHQVIQAAMILKKQGWLQTNEPSRGTFKSSISGKAERHFKLLPNQIAKDLNINIDFSRFQQGGEA